MRFKRLLTSILLLTSSFCASGEEVNIKLHPPVGAKLIYLSEGKFETTTDGAIDTDYSSEYIKLRVASCDDKSCLYEASINGLVVPAKIRIGHEGDIGKIEVKGPPSYEVGKIIGKLSVYLPVIGRKVSDGEFQKCSSAIPPEFSNSSLGENGFMSISCRLLRVETISDRKVAVIEYSRQIRLDFGAKGSASGTLFIDTETGVLLKNEQSVVVRSELGAKKYSASVTGMDLLKTDISEGFMPVIPNNSLQARRP